jgi:hypothetical protein
MFYNAGLLIALSLVGPCALTMISFSHQVQLRTLRFPLTTHSFICALMHALVSYFIFLLLAYTFYFFLEVLLHLYLRYFFG